MPRMGSEDIIALVKKLERLQNQLAREKDEVSKEYDSFKPETDARISIYSKLMNSCNSLRLALTFMATNLMDLQWWKVTSKWIIPEKDIAIYIKEFESFSKIGFIQLIFMSIESSLRLYLRKLAPTACNNGTAEFKTIYECLFRTHLSKIPNEGIELLDLLRNIRNTIHNNGVYFHKDGGNSSVTWRGQTYNFEYGKPIDFVTWDFILKVLEAIGGLVEEVVKDSNLKAVTDEITDPFLANSA